MKGIRHILFFFTLLASGELPALMDYGESTPHSGGLVRRPSKKPSPGVLSKSGIKRRSRFLHSKVRANFSLGMESVEAESNHKFWIVDSYLQTPWDVFVAGRYRRRPRRE